MYSDNALVREVVALARAHNIRHAIVCAGSRNAPLAHSFAACPDIEAIQCVDERSAAFEALGMAEVLQEPVIVCVTSGSAMLDAAPAIAEAFYQEIPLILVSADRPSCWIDQRDGQTMHQPYALKEFVRCSVQLPESGNISHANRLINMAYLAARGPVPGPVHINVPIDEPFFSCTTPELPAPRVLHAERPSGYDVSPDARAEILSARRILIAAGQMPADPDTQAAIARLGRYGVVTIAEHLANLPADTGAVTLADLALAVLSEEESRSLAPDLVITIGGHIVSKRFKRFLRSLEPLSHWHTGTDDSAAPDVFQHLTRLVRTDTNSFLAALEKVLAEKEEAQEKAFQSSWQKMQAALAAKVQAYFADDCLPFSDLACMAHFFNTLPEGSYLHLANSSPVRNAQYFSLPENTHVYCNRGVNGIDGSLSAALGNAIATDRPVFCLIGDLSFFYDSNALWRQQLPGNLHILLFNNGGGNIFRTLPGLNSPYRDTFIAGSNSFSAREQAMQAHLAYASAKTATELDRELPGFVSSNTACLLEVCTDAEICARAQKELVSAVRG
ncbi:MAG: 2-succinyl-5-enolpyruvyl-6-hydroxy-3-cyclohexene-1-carboxylic-acid synthase [Desulfovibrionaceae bacterium]|nr:2-succinyl-5-enolpyruvyl-6-hydroxy-3-cyclohexene-1-carboxylic-acid synthase [Desulfovibrionaceae bacterium]